jgi:hypothetical protein
MAEQPRHFPDSTALCEHIRRVSGDTCILSFSAGKDAICAWIQARRYFKHIVPFYLYNPPGLEFVEEGLRYYEKVFGERIIRLPHPSLWRMLTNFVYQPPERCLSIEQARLPSWDYKQLEAFIRRKYDLADAFVAVGTRTADSPIRLANVRRFGSCNYVRKTFLPVYDWRIDDVVREIRGAGVKLTIDYQLFGRSFDGIDYRFLKPIRERFPRDYQRILEWYPFADMDLFKRGEL